MFAYIRVSSLKQEKGLSLPAQAGLLTEYIDKYIAYKLGEAGFEWDRKFCADVCSAKVMLSNRPAGATMLQEVKPGDHICMVGWDRLFRTLKDAGMHLTELHDHGITVHDTRSNIDMGTPIGRMMAMQMILFAEMEGGIRLERTNAVRQYKREHGLPVGASAPTGWDYDGKGKDRTFKVCTQSREMGAEIVRLRDIEGYSFKAIELLYYNKWAVASAPTKYRYELPKRTHSGQKAMNRPISSNSAQRLYWGHKLGWPLTGIQNEIIKLKAGGNGAVEPGEVTLKRTTELAAKAWRDRRDQITSLAGKRKRGFKPKPSQSIQELEAG